MEDFTRGTRVKFLNDVGSGEVTRIVDKDLVMVKTDDGFEYPVLKSELLITSISDDKIGMDPEDIAELQTSMDSGEKKAEDLEEEEPEAENTIKSEYRGPYEYRGIDKDSSFYRKALKAREREKAKERKKDTGIEEVDLHIGEIIDDYSDLTSGEIVEVQLARFKTSLEGAIRAGQKRIVYIHGRGAGKLKRDIARIIDTEYPGCKHQDASFAEYGYGATLIIIK